MTKFEKPAAIAGALTIIAAVITVGGFVTGVLSLEQLIRLIKGEPQAVESGLPAASWQSRPGTQLPLPDPPPDPPQVEEYGALAEAPVLFDPQTGEAMVSFCGDPQGEYELYRAPVAVSPRTGRRCETLTPELRDTLQATSAKRAEQELKAERERAQREAALERHRSEAAFRARHTNEAMVDALPRNSPFVVLAIDRPSLESRIATALRQRGTAVYTGVFHEAIFSHSVYRQLAAGDPELLERLGLKGLPGRLLLGRFQISPARATGIGNTVNRSAQLAASVVPLAQGPAIALPPLAETGAAFGGAEAQAAAEDRVVQTLMELPEILRVAG